MKITIILICNHHNRFRWAKKVRYLKIITFRVHIQLFSGTPLKRSATIPKKRFVRAGSLS